MTRTVTQNVTAQISIIWGFIQFIFGNPTYVILQSIGRCVWMGAVAGRGCYGGGFALLVILFILLIIVGSAYVGWC